MGAGAYLAQSATLVALWFTAQLIAFGIHYRQDHPLQVASPDEAAQVPTGLEHKVIASAQGWNLILVREDADRR